MKVELKTELNTIKESIILSIEGARFAKKSLGRSDSMYQILGANDFALAKKLANTHNASGHDKFLQQIPFIVDISAARFFWQELDTYRVGVSKQSESTMHTILQDNININDFDIFDVQDEKLLEFVTDTIQAAIDNIQHIKDMIKLGDIEKEEARRAIKTILPESFIQKRRVSMNYAVMKTIYSQRKNHRNKEWPLFLDYMKSVLPYSELWSGK